MLLAKSNDTIALQTYAYPRYGHAWWAIFFVVICPIDIKLIVIDVGQLVFLLNEELFGPQYHYYVRDQYRHWRGDAFNVDPEDLSTVPCPEKVIDIGSNDWQVDESDLH